MGCGKSEKWVALQVIWIRGSFGNKIRIIISFPFTFFLKKSNPEY
jgi:hypothetical protein